MRAGRRCILGAVLYFNLTILASLLVRTVLSHLCLPFLPTMRSSLVAVLLTALNPREKDAGEPERVLGGRDGLSNSLS